jgi:serine/threonine protein kinase
LRFFGWILLFDSRTPTCALPLCARDSICCSLRPPAPLQNPPSHPAVPRLEDFFFDARGRIEVVLELCAGGELFDWVAARDEGLTEGEARGVFRQVAAGVAHLHGLGIAHRDLKPQNLMYVADPAGGAGVVKIVDYDLAKVGGTMVVL